MTPLKLGALSAKADLDRGERPQKETALEVGPRLPFAVNIAAAKPAALNPAAPLQAPAPAPAAAVAAPGVFTRALTRVEPSVPAIASGGTSAAVDTRNDAAVAHDIGGSSSTLADARAKLLSLSDKQIDALLPGNKYLSSIIKKLRDVKLEDSSALERLITSLKTSAHTGTPNGSRACALRRAVLCFDSVFH